MAAHEWENMSTPLTSGDTVRTVPAPPVSCGREGYKPAWWAKLRRKNWLRGYWVYVESNYGRCSYVTKAAALEAARWWAKMNEAGKRPIKPPIYGERSRMAKVTSEVRFIITRDLLQAALAIAVHMRRHPTLAKWIVPKRALHEFYIAADKYNRMES